MLDFITWIESRECQPMRNEIIALLRTGKVIQEPTARSGDLEYYINDDDGPDDDLLRDRVWIEVDVPIGWFGCQFVPKELGYGATDPTQIGREKEREERLGGWVGSVGGWAKALNISPVLAVLGQNIRFLDGWHRSKLAQAAGHTTVRTVVGVKADVYKNEIAG